MTIVEAPVGVATGGHGIEFWSQQRWLAEATAWLDTRLDALGIDRTGPVEQPHLRSWATALRAPTSKGVVWLKAAGPTTDREIGLYEVLVAQVPQRVLTPLVVDRNRGWIVLPEGGRVLGRAADEGSLVDALCAVVPEYAQLQLGLMASVDEILAVGVPDMRPERMPARLREALDVVRPYVAGSADAAAAEALYRQLVAAADSYDTTCEELAAGPVAASLQHDDLHPGNVFADRFGTDPVFFDWGDSVVAHPFASMLVTLRVVKRLAGVPDDSHAVHRVRDAYLEPFTHLAPRNELVDLLEQACHVGKVGRCLSWAGVLGSFTAVEGTDVADAPFGWLSLLLDDSYLGSVSDDD